MASVDNKFISVGGSAMKCSLIRHKFFRLHNTELMNIDFGKPVGKIIVNTTCIVRELPPKI
jgi:hypothetical protein